MLFRSLQLEPLTSYAFIDNDKYKSLYGIDSQGSLYMIVSTDYVFQQNLDYYSSLRVFIASQQHVELTKELEDLGYNIEDHTQNFIQDRQIFLIIEIFIYGFVCIMIFFTMLNIINMMSASIEKRKKEFGMMLSVGMSPHGIHKMIWYEIGRAHV